MAMRGVLDDSPFVLAGDITRQNRLIFFILIIGSIVLLLIIIIGAPIYYYKYGRGDTKASISKNPNYGMIQRLCIGY